MARRSIVITLTAGILISLLGGCMFLKNYGLVVSTNDIRWGWVYLAGTQIPASGDYGYGEVVGIEAFSSTYCTFDHWEGDLSGTDPAVSVTMDASKNITAVFTCQAGGVAGMAATYDKAFGIQGVTVTLNEEYVDPATTLTDADGNYSFPAPIRFGQVTAEKSLFTFVQDPSVTWTGLDDTNRYSLNFLVSAFEDSFEDPSSGWTLTSGDNSVGYAGGALVMRFGAAGAATLTSLMPIRLPNPDVIHHSLVITADAPDGIESLGVTVDHGAGHVYQVLIFPDDNRMLITSDGGFLYDLTDSSIASPYTITLTEDSFIVFDVNGSSSGPEIPEGGWDAGTVTLKATLEAGATVPVQADFQSAEFEVEW